MIFNNLKNWLVSRLSFSALNVMLACEQSELPRASRNIKSLLSKETNIIVSRFLIVITGRVPVILWQRVTNLVNKVALLLHKYRFSPDCRNKSGNDGCWGRWLSVYCKFFKYPSPDTNVPTSPARGEVLKQVLRPQCAQDATGFLSDVYKRSTRAQKFLADGVQYGRSMIEMLGVLAIIAVLSVGGIAGYSKAMEKYESNKQLELLEELLANAISIRENLLGMKNHNETDITPVFKALNAIPDGFTYKNNSIYDKDGNYANVSYGIAHHTDGNGNPYSMFIYAIRIWTNAGYAGKAKKSTIEYCKNIMLAAQKFPNEIEMIAYSSKDSQSSIGTDMVHFYSKGKFYMQLTPAEINNKCQMIYKEAGRAWFHIRLKAS